MESADNTVFENAAGVDRAALAQDLANAVTAYPNTIKHLLPDKYAPYYESWLERHRDTIAALAVLEENDFDPFAQALVCAIDSWAEEKGGLFATRNSRLEDTKYTLCLVAVPGIQAICKERGAGLCRTIHACWMTHHPDHVFQVTTFEEICQGFHQRKLCFITTAACAHQGKADDCEELTAFRRFRDGYLAQSPDGRALISEYYRLAPGIVTAISLCDDPQTVYPALWEQYLQPCYRDILAGENDLCRERYTQMVRSLARRYPVQ